MAERADAQEGRQNERDPAEVSLRGADLGGATEGSRAIASPASDFAKAEATDREMAARMLTYRLVPLWIFLAVFGLTLVWESGVQGNPITAAKLQAAALISLFFALIIGAVVGIRFFNPLPPKA